MTEYINQVTHTQNLQIKKQNKKLQQKSSKAELYQSYPDHYERKTLLKESSMETGRLTERLIQWEGCDFIR